MYSATLGRFMQTDPIGYGDGLNFYAYVGNDPVNFVDPLGLEEIESCFTVDDSYNDGDTIVVISHRECITRYFFEPVEQAFNAFQDITLDALCAIGNVGIGYGYDAYTLLDGSGGVDAQVDLARGRVNVNLSTSVGAGYRVDYGPNAVRSSPTNGIGSLNLIGSVGLPQLGPLGGTYTENIYGTDTGATSVNVGRAGAGVGFLSLGVSGGLQTPSLYSACYK